MGKYKHTSNVQTEFIISKMKSLVLWLVPFLLSQVEAYIECYECDSSNNFTCTEFWDPNLVTTEVYLTNCQHVYGASYCVKMTGIFDGKLGTKRFCSSKGKHKFIHSFSKSRVSFRHY